MKTIKYYSTLREANYHRQREWCGGEPQVPLLFRTTELAGEAGEAMECIVSDSGTLAEELADVVITADLLAADLGIDFDLPDLVDFLHSHQGASAQPTSLGIAVGLVCNQVKKMERSRLGWRGSLPNMDDLEMHLRLVIMITFLIAQTKGIVLMDAVEHKFNATGKQLGLGTRLRLG